MTEKTAAKTLCVLICCLVAGLLPVNAAEIKVFKLRYAGMDSVCNVIRDLFGSKVRTAPAPSINAIVVNADDAELLKEIEKLVAVLDRKPATLRFSIKSDSSNSEKASSIGWSNGPAGSNSSSRQTTSGGRTITALEFAKASITDEMIRVFSLPAWPEEQTVMLTTTRGLKISGQLAEKNQVMVQLWYSEGAGMESEQLLTELLVPTDSWVSFGGLEQRSDSRSVSSHAGSEIKAVRKKTGHQIDSRFLLKVEVIR